jgi:hypothetical protein
VVDAVALACGRAEQEEILRRVRPYHRERTGLEQDVRGLPVGLQLLQVHSLLPVVTRQIRMWCSPSLDASQTTSHGLSGEKPRPDGPSDRRLRAQLADGLMVAIW